MKWDYLKEIKMDNNTKAPHIQPMSLGMIGLEENDSKYPQKDIFSVFGLLCMRRFCENELQQSPKENLDPVSVALNSSQMLMSYYMLSMKAVVKKRQLLLHHENTSACLSFWRSRIIASEPKMEITPVIVGIITICFSFNVLLRFTSGRGIPDIQ